MFTEVLERCGLQYDLPAFFAGGEIFALLARNRLIKLMVERGYLVRWAVRRPKVSLWQQQVVTA